MEPIQDDIETEFIRQAIPKIKELVAERDRLIQERVEWELGLQDKLDSVTGERDRLIQALEKILASEPSSDDNLRMWARFTVTSIAREALTKTTEEERV